MLIDIPSKLHDCGRQYALTHHESLKRVCAATRKCMLSTFCKLPLFYFAYRNASKLLLVVTFKYSLTLGEGSQSFEGRLVDFCM